MTRTRVVLALMLSTASTASAAYAQTVVQGRVIDARSQQPVVGAQVSLVGGTRAVVTGADGEWRVGVPSDGRALQLRIERIGYAVAERAIDAGQAPERVIIELEPSALELDAVIVSASRRMQRLADAPVTVELISRAELAEAGAADVATVLTERAGLELDAGHPSGAGVIMRGFGSERVLILLDGQPLTGRLSGNFDVSRLPASLLERVEIVKGPQSTLYGSDAIGGVINLITRKPGDDWDAAMELTGGSARRLNAGVRLQGRIAGVSTSLEAGRRTIESTFGDVNAAGALTEQWDGLLSLGASVAAVALEGSLMIVDERQRWRTGQLYNFADNLQAAARFGGAYEAGRTPHSHHGARLDVRPPLAPLQFGDTADSGR